MLDITKLKVLVVDDHFLARQVVSDVMHEMKIPNVVTVGDGNVARDTLNSAHAAGEPFDVVFLDRNLPGLEGLELLQQFRAKQEFKSTAFIMLTSASEQADVIKAIKAGATGYLIKPVPKLAISKKLKEILTWLEQQKNASA